MKRQDLMAYLEQNGCVLVRNANQGYSIVRNVVSGKMSGVPVDEDIYPASVCRICKTLAVDPPEEAKLAQDIVEAAHRRHGTNNNE
jgi:hypothetical protein